MVAREAKGADTLYPSPMKGLGLQRRIFSLGEVSEPTNSKGLLGGEEAFSNEKRQDWKPVSSLERGIVPESAGAAFPSG
jgi:hypothetical protein